MTKMKINKKALLASKKDKMHKINIQNKRKSSKSKMVKRRGGLSLKNRKLELKSKKVKKIVKIEKPKRKKVDDEPIVENFPSEDFMNLTNQVKTHEKLNI